MKAASAALNVASGFAALKSSRAERNAYNMQAGAYEQQARVVDIQARQAATHRLNELNANLAAIAAKRAGSNSALDSPSALAIDEAFTQESKDAMSNDRLSALMQARKLRTEAGAARLSGRAALIRGYTQAAQYGFNAITDVSSFMKKP